MAALSDVLIISYRTVLTACPQVLVLSTGASQFTIFQGRGMKKKPDLYQKNKRGKFLKKLRCCVGGELTFRALALRRNKSIHSDEELTHQTWAFASLYGGQLTLSTQLIKQNYRDLYLLHHKTRWWWFLWFYCDPFSAQTRCFLESRYRCQLEHVLVDGASIILELTVCLIIFCRHLFCLVSVLIILIIRVLINIFNTTGFSYFSYFFIFSIFGPFLDDLNGRGRHIKSCINSD